MTTAAAPLALKYIYVDTAFGGVNRRNQVKRLDAIYVLGRPRVRTMSLHL